MNNDGQAINVNYFNNWVVSAIFISIIFMIYLASEVSGSSRYDVIYQFMIGWSSLVIIGAVSILIGVVRAGAILIIVGGLSMIPIGMVGVIGGMRILELDKCNKYIARKMQEQGVSPANEMDLLRSSGSLETRNSATACETEGPLYEQKAEHFGPMLPMGLLMTSGGFVMFFLGVLHGEVIFGFGLMGILLAFVLNSSKVRIFGDHLELKLSFYEWQAIPYQEVIEISSTGERKMKLRYNFCGQEKTVMFDRSVWGEGALSRIYEAISECVEDDKLDVNSKEQFTPVTTRFVSVQKNREEGQQGRAYYQILTQWKAPDTGKTYLFKSDNIWFDPAPYIEVDIVTVFVEPGDPASYRMDTSFLPDLA
jgi:hypothetical protein